MVLWIVLAGAISFNALANILIKAGMRSTGESVGLLAMGTKALTSPFMIMGILSFILALAAYSFVLSKMNLSVAYPIMTSVGFVIVNAASIIFFKEKINHIQYLGLICILLGVWLVTANGR